MFWRSFESSCLPESSLNG